MCMFLTHYLPSGVQVVWVGVIECVLLIKIFVSFLQYYFSNCRLKRKCCQLKKQEENVSVVKKKLIHSFGKEKYESILEYRLKKHWQGTRI